MMEIACTCDDLPPHGHVYRPRQMPGGFIRSVDTGDIRIWVDWKEVARAFAIEQVRATT